MKKKIITIMLIINLIIGCNTIVFGYPSANSSTPNQPVENPNSHTNGSTGGTEGPYGSNAANPQDNIGSGYNPNAGNITVEEPDMTGTLGNPNVNSLHTPDEIMGEAEDFLNSGSNAPINGSNLKKASTTLYNILLSLGIFLAVAIGMYLGVKFMLSNAEDKAKVKEALIPYIVGCIVIFSAFIIWRLVILLLGGIS